MLRAIADAVLDAVQTAGPDGLPAGPLYHTLMAYGCTYHQFTLLMGALVGCGKIRHHNNCYFAVSQ
jgi:hypothetical protein